MTDKEKAWGKVILEVSSAWRAETSRVIRSARLHNDIYTQLCCTTYLNSQQRHLPREVSKVSGRFTQRSLYMGMLPEYENQKYLPMGIFRQLFVFLSATHIITSRDRLSQLLPMQQLLYWSYLHFIVHVHRTYQCITSRPRVGEISDQYRSQGFIHFRGIKNSGKIFQ